MDEQRQNDQLETIYTSSEPIQDVAWRTFQERRTIETGGERGSGKSVLAARRDDDDCNVSPTIQLNISHLYTQPNSSLSNNSI